jgi:hypothetical protein
MTEGNRDLRDRLMQGSRRKPQNGLPRSRSSSLGVSTYPL